MVTHCYVLFGACADPFVLLCSPRPYKPADPKRSSAFFVGREKRPVCVRRWACVRAHVRRCPRVPSCAKVLGTKFRVRPRFHLVVTGFSNTTVPPILLQIRSFMRNLRHSRDFVRTAESRSRRRQVRADAGSAFFFPLFSDDVMLFTPTWSTHHPHKIILLEE